MDKEKKEALKLIIFRAITLIGLIVMTDLFFILKTRYKALSVLEVSAYELGAIPFLIFMTLASMIFFTAMLLASGIDFKRLDKKK